jgi:hypothetical protein
MVSDFIEDFVQFKIIRNQQVSGSSPLAGSIHFKGFQQVTLKPLFYSQANISANPGKLKPFCV